MKISAENWTGSAVARVIVDPAPRTGRLNMALDETLLNRCREQPEIVVRVYRWSAPTLSVGYFQKDTASCPAGLQSLPVVRRLSGGGAILHDQELTYSCVLPAAHSIRSNPSGLYPLVHRNLIDLLCRCGANVLLRSEADRASNELESATAAANSGSAGESYLCFLRTNENDIVTDGGIKVVGSAQRRRRGVILQHGSVLLRCSVHAEQLPGLEDLFPGFNTELLQNRMADAIASAVADRWEAGQFSAAELAEAMQAGDLNTDTVGETQG